MAGALQTAAFVAIGRVFDQRSPHNVDALIRLAQRDPTIFTKEALSARKRRSSANADEWLAGYLRGVRVPAPADFRRIRKLVQRYRRVYDAQVDRIRDKYFAHREVTDESDVHALFENTRVRDLERLAVFLVRLHSAFWNLFHNGSRLCLRPAPYSVRRLVGKPLSQWSGRTQEAIVRDAKACLTHLAEVEKVAEKRGAVRPPKRGNVTTVRRPRRQGGE